MAKLRRRFCRTVGGVVTVQGTQAFDTLQFSTNGYELAGGSLLLGPSTGTLNVDGGITATVGSTIGGAGKSLGKVGAGTLILTGDNTYTGPTTISAGTLQIGSGGTTGSVAGDIVDKAPRLQPQRRADLWRRHQRHRLVTKCGAGTLI